MSFAKAKLLRFNEETTCAPPPGKYDPKFDSKIRGAVIEKSKRFVDTKIESAPSVCSFDSNSSCSFSNKPTFRTPQLPRKKITSTPRSAFEIGKCSSRTFDIKSRKKLDEVFKNETQSNLVDQIDELTRVHTSQLIEKDQEISTLYNEISDLKSSLVKAENSREIDYNNMKQKYDMEMNKIKTELEDAHSLLEKEREEHEQIVKDLKNQVKMLDENLMNSSALNAELEFQLSDANLSLIEMKNYYATLQEELKKTSDNLRTIAQGKEAEINAIKEQSNESLKNLTLSAEFNLETLSKKMEERILNLREQLEKLRIDDEEDLFEKINMISSEAQNKVEQFNERASEVFENVKQMAQTFDEKSKELIDSLSSCLKVNCEKLLEFAKTAEDFEQEKVSNLENKIKIVDLEEKVSILEGEVGKLKNQCRKYEIVHNETTKTINVLSTRLFESESEVENMNEIKEELVLRKNALEEKISSLRNENEELKEKITTIELSIVQDVMDVEKNLISRVENYQKCSTEETAKLKTEIEEQKTFISSLLAEIASYKHKISELNEHKLFYEEIGTKYKEEIESLSYKFKDLESRYSKNMNSQKTKNSELSRLLEEAKSSVETKEKQFLEEIDKLQEEKQNLEKDCLKKNAEVENLKMELAHVSSKMEKMESDIALMEENGFEQEKQIEELAEQLDHYTKCGLKSSNQIISLSKELEEKESEIARLQDEWTEKDLKIETLTAELTESKTYVQTMTEHVVALMSDLAEKTKEIENLTNDIDIKNNTMIQVSDEYEKMKNLYNEEAKKCEEIEKELHDVQSENEKYVDEIISELVLEKERCSELAQCSEEASSSYRNSLDIIKGLEDKNQELTNQQRDVEERLEAVEKELEDKTEENQILLQKKDQMSEIIKSYQDQIQNLEDKLISRNEELQNELDSLKQNEIALNEQNFDLNNLNNALERKVKDKDAAIAELKEATSHLNGKLDELMLEKDDLVQMVKRQWEEMELLTNEISNQQEEIDDLKQAKEDKLDEVRALHQTELQNQIFALQQSLEDTQKVVIELKTKEEDLVFKLKSAEADLTQAETDKEEYEKNLIDLKCQVTDIESRFEAMEKRKNEYKLYAVEMENENQRMKQEIQFLNEEKENMQGNKNEISLVSLNEQVADLESRNQVLESIIGPFREQLVQFEKERAELLSRSENTEKELKALALEHAKSLGHQNHKQKIRHVVHLTETISDLKKEMEKLRTENNKLRATILEQQESTFKKSCNAAKGKKDKENTVEAVPLVKHKNERQSSPANPLKQRNIT